MASKLLFALGLAASSAHAAAPPPAQCSMVTPARRAPCGQVTDSATLCAAKNCCFDASDAVNPCFYPTYEAVNITKVYVVQSCHFDAGYAGFTTEIINRWFDQFWPRAYSLGTQLASNATGPQLRFMAQSWLVSLYLNCPPGAGLHCPNASALADFTSAVAAGFITWHAWPFNGEMELGDASMLAYGLNLTWELDDLFSLPRKRVVSQRDVPGTTLAAMPLLAGAGVAAFSLGANSGSTPAAVPRAFVWRDAASNVSMPFVYHPAGYGGIGYEDTVIIPGVPYALSLDWRGDNAGPPMSVGEVQSNWANISATFPGAEIVAATFDEWVDAALTPEALARLPVITAEMGDTWIHGVSSDVQKTAWWRLGTRLRADCLAAGDCDMSDPAFRNFSRLWIKNMEHTWGHDTKSMPGDYKHYSNAELQAVLNTTLFQDAVSSWQEQRNYGVVWAVQALPEAHPLRIAMEAAFATVYPPPTPPSPLSNGYVAAPLDTLIPSGRFSLGFTAGTPGISTLIDSVTGVTWAAGGSDFVGAPAYMTYTEDDFNYFVGNYSILPDPASQSWFEEDYGRPNVSLADPEHFDVMPSVLGVWMKTLPGATSFLMSVAWEAQMHDKYGAPSQLWLQYDVPSAGGSVNITVQLYNKTATRIGEGLFFKFNPKASAAGADGQWYVDKMGQRWIDPYAIMMNGNMHQHATLNGIKLQSASGASTHSMAIASTECALVNVGADTLLPFPVNQVPDAGEGIGFVLLNNAWSTNYPLWQPWTDTDVNMQWHFTMTLA